MKKAILFEKLLNNEVKCTACSWYCRIKEGKTGICAARYNKNGLLYSLVYGKTTGLAIDPVEKKPLYHFYPGSKILSLGTVGCNFGCLFCQNAWMSQITKNQYSDLINTVDKYSENISPSEIVEKAISIGVLGIAYTYNEPAIYAEFAHDTALIARRSGLKNIFVSNGYESAETFEYIRKYLDAINIDLKSFSDDFYIKICKARIKSVKENIRRFFESGIHTEVTTLVVPGINDNEEELEQIAQFIFKISPVIPWHITAFKPEYRMSDMPPTPIETLIKAYDIGKKAGLKYVYLGNIDDTKRSSTFCPGCNELLISRNGYDVKINKLQNGKCIKCGARIYGKFN